MKKKNINLENDNIKEKVDMEEVVVEDTITEDEVVESQEDIYQRDMYEKNRQLELLSDEIKATEKAYKKVSEKYIGEERDSKINEIASKLVEMYIEKSNLIMSIYNIANEEENLDKYVYDLEKTLQKTIRYSAQCYNTDSEHYRVVLTSALEDLITLEEQKDQSKLSDYKKEKLENCINEYKELLNYVKSENIVAENDPESAVKMDDIKNLKVKNYGRPINKKAVLTYSGIGAGVIIITALLLSSCGKGNGGNATPTPVPTSTVTDFLKPSATPTSTPTNAPVVTEAPVATPMPKDIIEEEMDKSIASYDEYKETLRTVTAKFVIDGAMTMDQANVAMYYFNGSDLSLEDTKKLVNENLIPNDVSEIINENANAITTYVNSILNDRNKGNKINVYSSDFIVNEESKAIVSEIDELCNTIYNGTDSEALAAYQELFEIICYMNTEKVTFSKLSANQQFQVKFLNLLPANIVAGTRGLNFKVYVEAEDDSVKTTNANDYIDEMMANLVNPLAMENGIICDTSAKTKSYRKNA